MTDQTQKKSFTGRTRERKTRLSIRVMDHLASTLISVGGIGTIVAVLGVFLFLFWVAAWLFVPAHLSAPVTLETPWENDPPLKIVTDDYQILGWILEADGQLQVFRFDTGEAIGPPRRLFPNKEITATAFLVGSEDVGFGFADGSVVIGQIRFDTKYFEPDGVDSAIRNLEPSKVAPLEDGMIQRTPQNQYRLQTVQTEFQEPMQLADSPVRRLAMILSHSNDGALDGGRLATITDDGQTTLHGLKVRTNLLTQATTITTSKPVAVPTKRTSQGADDLADWLLLTGRGDTLYLAWQDGHAERFDARLLSKVQFAEEFDFLADSGDAATLTEMRLLAGRETIISGDSLGGLAAWFVYRPNESQENESDLSGEENQAIGAEALSPDDDVLADRVRTPDNAYLVRGHQLPPIGSAVTALGMSDRSRVTAAAHADGQVRIFNVTNESLLAQTQFNPGQAVIAVGFSPRNDSLFAATKNGFWRSKFNPVHPEVSLSSLFLPVWYEGYREADTVWQSSASRSDFEMKLGVYPLVFGTIKATIYSMLIGAPLALLAALYSSEFLQPRWRSRIKPAIEIMAGLPSVVLGFLAAIVFAPLVARFLPLWLCLFFTVPFCVVLAANLWQFLPQKTRVLLERGRLFFVLLALAVGFFMAWQLAQPINRLLYSGDIMAWLDGQKGAATGGWFILFLPLSALAALAVVGQWINPWLRRRVAGWSRFQVATASLGKFLVGTAVTLSLALGTSYLLTKLGFDPRGTYVGTYEQLNALIVGFVMGFAVIPIIYTIAEDALSTVPDHLRSASLGAGATPWQTAVRVVIPAAMSGLFSAMMIGLGRAVGETMIVLMAGGNTPVRSWNIFNGFRTLSMNIATELPEAVQNSTHYRTLFFSALTLFVMTFMINTIAEVVRLRFRRRAYQL